MTRPGARRARSGAFASLGALAALAAGAPPATAQDAEDRPAVLLVLDASRSMRAPSGDGTGDSRLDAAKAAVEEVLDTVPEDAPLGLRVYGARVAGQGRAKACADTELVAPVAAGDRAQVRSAVQALEGKGRTPIGRSLLATPDDFGDDGRTHDPNDFVLGRKQVILVSDGLDNCSPPSPCAAARRVSKRGVELTISVVGFALDARARRQMRCIARAGGGTYVDANDTDRLREELLAAFARAFRSYEPAGTPVQGGTEPADAPRLGEGQYRDELRPGDARDYMVSVGPGQRLLVSITSIPDRATSGNGTLRADLTGADGPVVTNESVPVDGDTTGQFGQIDTISLRAPQAAAPGVPSDLRPGDFNVHMRLEEGSLDPRPVPVEIWVQALDAGEAPGEKSEPGPPPEPAGTLQPSATPAATPRGEPAAADDGSGADVVVAAGAGGILAGVLGGLVAGRRRRR
jgi:Ca-activated chloride channel family protein